MSLGRTCVQQVVSVVCYQEQPECLCLCVLVPELPRKTPCSQGLNRTVHPSHRGVRARSASAVSVGFPCSLPGFFQKPPRSNWPPVVQQEDSILPLKGTDIAVGLARCHMTHAYAEQRSTLSVKQGEILRQGDKSSASREDAVSW